MANRRVAEKIATRKNKEGEAKTFVYRVHDEPNPEKLIRFSEFLKKLGYDFQTSSRKSITTSFNQLFDKILGKGEENMIETIAIRTMARAEYTTHNIGHYGLSFRYYTHFTSPIRRYPDLMVHRLLQRYLDDKSSAAGIWSRTATTAPSLARTIASSPAPHPMMSTCLPARVRWRAGVAR